MEVIKEEVHAMMVPDFKSQWLTACMVDDGFDTIAEADHAYNELGDLDRLAERIAGKEVTLIKQTYATGTTDYFEKLDNNFVIFPELFTQLASKGDD